MTALTWASKGAEPGRRRHHVAKAGRPHLGQALRLFALRCRSLNLAAGTQALYAIRLDGWRAWLSKHGDPQPPDVRADIIRRFLEDMKASSWKDATLDSAYRILRTLFGWLEREGLIVANPMRRVERPKRERRLIRPFSEEQLRAA